MRLRILAALLVAAPVSGQTVGAKVPDLKPAVCDSIPRLPTQGTGNQRLRDRLSARCNAIVSRPLKPDTVFLPPTTPLDTTVVACEVTPRSGPWVLVGDTIRFRAACVDSSNVVRAVPIAWRSGNQGIATITAGGLARGVVPAFVWIHGSSGAVGDSVRLEVRAPEQPDPDPTEPGVCSRTIDGAVAGNLTLVPGERACVGPSLRVAGNVLVKDAVLQMRPGSNLTIVGADPNAYVGGGMEYSAALDSDRGVWVWGSGQLDIACSTKLGWNRTGADPTWRATDEYWIAPTAVGDFTPRRWTPGQPVPNVGGGMPSAEVVNVTRDCSITGPGHIHIHSTKPQRVENVALVNMGVSKNREPVLGRYAIHSHMSGEGARGSVWRGIACVNSGGKCFVPHNSHGVTMIDNVCLNSFAECLWWDPATETDDLKADRLGVLGVTEGGYDGIVLDAGVRNVLSNSWCAGVRGSDQANCHEWPEPGPHYDPVLAKLVWDFSTGNVAHNNAGSGLRFWNNEQEIQTVSHVVANYVGYRNHVGIENGAYVNCNQYRNVTLFEEGGDAWFGGLNTPAVIWGNNSGACTGGRTARFEDSRIHSRNGPAVVIGGRQVPAGAPMVWEDMVLVAAAGFPKVLVLSAIAESNPWRAHFIRSGVRPEDVVFQSCTGNNEGSEVLIDGPEGSWTVRCENGQKIVRSR